MGAAAEKTRAAFAKARERTEAAVRGNLHAVEDRLMVLSPVGDPALWQRPSAPDGYEGGRFRSNWNYDAGAIDRSTTTLTGVHEVNGLAEATKMIGVVHYISNALPYAQALEYGHSSHAPAGVMAVLAHEAPDLAERAARLVAR